VARITVLDPTAAPPEVDPEIFVDNLRRYAAGEPVLHVVDADEGY